MVGQAHHKLKEETKNEKTNYNGIRQISLFVR